MFKLSQMFRATRTTALRNSISFTSSVFVLFFVFQKIHRALHTTYEDVGKELTGLDEK